MSIAPRVRSELELLKARFRTGDVLTESNMGMIMDAIPSQEDLDHLYADKMQVQPVATGTHSSGLTTSCVQSGDFYSIFGGGATTAQTTVMSDGLALVMPTALANALDSFFQGGSAHISALVYDSANKAYVANCALEITRSGLRIYPASGAALVIPQGGSIHFQTMLILGPLA